jgi:hypothetical protein
MMRKHQLPFFVVIAAFVGSHAPAAFAVSRCGVGRLRDGTLTVRSAGVSGSLRWGGQLGEETHAFDNAATCLSGTRARLRARRAGDARARDPAGDVHDGPGG